MLSIILSVYDPLRLVFRVVINGQVLFKEATHLKLPWYDEVPTNKHRVQDMAR